MFGSREEKSDLITVIKASQPRRVRIDADFVRTTLFFLFLAACIAFIGVLLYKSDHRNILVEDKYWTSTVSIEEYKTVVKSSWELPDGVKLLYEQSEPHHYVNSGLGYGKYDAVYETRYYYEAEEWVQVRDVMVTGREREKPYYGEVTLADNEREGERHITYYIKAIWDDGKVIGELPVKPSIWGRLNIGNYYTATSGSVDGKAMVVKAKERDGF